MHAYDAFCKSPCESYKSTWVTCKHMCIKYSVNIYLNSIWLYLIPRKNNFVYEYIK
jgi:hypothetical protein